MSGCAACIKYFEISGEYAAQEAEAAARKQQGHPEPSNERRYVPVEPPDLYQQFKTKFRL